MFTRIKQLVNRENGNALILVSLAMVGLLGMTGLVIDGGSLFMTKSHLQKSANAAALSGAQALFIDEDSVKKVVNEVLEFHKEDMHLNNLEVIEEKRVNLQLRKEVPLIFSSIFAQDTAPVEVNAAAEIGVMSSAVGAVPLGIDERFQLEFNKPYELKTDTTGVNAGWFGILALGGPGAATYYDNFKNGYKHEISVGDVIDTQTGNVAGPTKSAVKERIDKCPYTMQKGIEKKCSRIVLVPVYQAYTQTSNQVKQVKVKGFAYFYLTEPISGNDTSIHGMFIKLTGPGIIDDTATNRGAYSIRLTE